MKRALAVVAMVSALGASPVHAQIWIGQIAADAVNSQNAGPDINCMMGRTRLSARHLERRRVPVIAGMNRYLHHAQTTATGNRSSFHDEFTELSG